jgi:predicted amidophosphoribosyltransferase
MQPRSCEHSGAERLLTPRHGPGVCPRCFNLLDADLGLCRPCQVSAHHIAAFVPISYSVGAEWLHNLIITYKRGADPSVPDASAELAWILDRFISAHEHCVATAAGVGSFPVITTVPSSDRRRDMRHPLRRIVGELTVSTRDRHERLLLCSSAGAMSHRFGADRYRATRRLNGESVLLIDDMWTTGASAQSAAAALRRAGAGSVAVVTIARHLNRAWHQNDSRLRAISRSESSTAGCAFCGDVSAAVSRFSHL